MHLNINESDRSVAQRCPSNLVCPTHFHINKQSLSLSCNLHILMHSSSVIHQCRKRASYRNAQDSLGNYAIMCDVENKLDNVIVQRWIN